MLSLISDGLKPPLLYIRLTAHDIFLFNYHILVNNELLSKLNGVGVIFQDIYDRFAPTSWD